MGLYVMTIEIGSGIIVMIVEKYVFAEFVKYQKVFPIYSLSYKLKIDSRSLRNILLLFFSMNPYLALNAMKVNSFA